MKLNRIEIVSIPGGFTVQVDDRFADRLGPDEALGVVASALFGERKPLFVQTYEQWVAHNRRYGYEPPGIAGLLHFL